MFMVTDMKKRSNDAKLNPGYNTSGCSGSVVDRQLIQRVEQASVDHEYGTVLHWLLGLQVSIILGRPMLFS